MVKTVITRVILQITNILDGRTQVDVSSIVQDLGAQSGVESIKCVLRLRQKAPPFNGYVASITWASSRQLSAAFPKAQGVWAQTQPQEACLRGLVTAAIVKELQRQTPVTPRSTAGLGSSSPQRQPKRRSTLDATTASAEKRAKFEKRPSNNPEGVNGGGRKKGSLRTRAYLKQAAERNVRKKKKNRRKTNERKKEKRREKVDAELQLNWAASKAYMEAQLPVLRAAHQFDIRAVWRSKSDRDDPSDDLRSVLSERQITKLRRQCLGIFVFYSSILDMGYTGQLECNRVDLARHAADHPGVWATPRTILK